MAEFQIEQENAPQNVLVFKPYTSSYPDKQLLNDAAKLHGSYLAPDGDTNQTGLVEATNLCKAIGLNVVYQALVPLKQARSSTLIGTGKIDEIAQLAQEYDAKLVLFDHKLTPRQQFKLEKLLNVKVLDRTGIILEIFGKRARTKEGRIQVELAHLEYQKTRLVRSWTHLERQRGGGGFLGGPGETQLESDRRQLQGKIQSLKSDLAKVLKTRQLHRSSRQKNEQLHFALVGYTNAGKSSIFNQLANESIFAKDMLFATLDPTIRSCHLPNGNSYVLSDTVGFIQDLPTDLVQSFKATLEEVVYADYILHVRDCSSPMWRRQKDSVLEILEGLGIDTDDKGRHIIEVWNKFDLLTPDQQTYIKAKASNSETDVIISSTIGEHGLEQLTKHIADQVSAHKVEVTFHIPVDQGSLVSWLYTHGKVINCQSDDIGTMSLHAQLSKAKWGLLNKTFPHVEKLIESVPTKDTA